MNLFFTAQSIQEAKESYSSKYNGENFHVFATNLPWIDEASYLIQFTTG